MSVSWWRSWHGAPTDLKWALIAKKTGAKTCEVISLSWALMDYASQSDERGSIDGFDIETYSLYSDISEEIIISIIEQMTEKGIIENNKFSKWEKRQPKSESEISRVQEYRRKKAESKIKEEISTALQNVTDCYGSLQNVTENYTDTDTDTEKNRLKDKELKDIGDSKKPESRGRNKNVNSEKSKQPKEVKQPEDIDYWKFLGENQQAGYAFYTATGIVPIKREFGMWNKGFKELAEVGITAEDIPKIVAEMKRRELTIKAPQSLLTIGREMKSGGFLPSSKQNTPAEAVEKERYQTETGEYRYRIKEKIS